MEDEFIEFEHWKTGEKIKYKLNFSHPSEQKTTLICPLDKTPLIFIYETAIKDYFCPNCGINYSIPSKTQEQVEKYFQTHISNLRKELSVLDNRKKDISLILEKAEKEGLNKANLSAEGTKNTDSLVDMDKYAKFEREFGVNE